MNICGRGRVFGIAIRYVLEDMGYENNFKRYIPYPSIPGSTPTQPNILNVYGVCLPRGKEAEASQWQSHPCAQFKERVELYLHPSVCSHGMLQTVLYLYVDYQNEYLCKTFTHNAVLSVTNGLLTSLVVASVSYHNCINKPVTYHVTVRRYFQYYILVTSLFRVLLCDVKKWYKIKVYRDRVTDFLNLTC